MNKKVNLDIEVLKIVYLENKSFLIPFCAIFVGLLLVIFFVLPQVNGIFQKQKLITAETEKLNNLKSSALVISQTNDLTLNNNLKLATLALPQNKDFAAIFNAITSASSLSNIILGDFEFQIGEITQTSKTPQSVGIPSLRISLNLAGDVESTVRFINELKKSVPISAIGGVKSSGSFATVELIFYYKPLPPQGVSDPEKILSIPASSQKLIDEIVIPIGVDLNSDNLPTVESSNPL